MDLGKLIAKPTYQFKKKVPEQVCSESRKKNAWKSWHCTITKNLYSRNIVCLITQLAYKMMKVVLKQGMLTCFPSIFKRNARCPVDSNPGILIWMTKAFVHLLLKLERKVWLYWLCFLPHNNETMTKQIFWFLIRQNLSLLLWINLLINYKSSDDLNS